MKLGPVMITPSMAVALAALVISLGGAGYAVTSLPRDSVTSAAVKDGAIASRDLARGAVSSREIKDGGIKLSDLSGSARAQLDATFSARQQSGVVVKTPGNPVTVLQLKVPAGSYGVLVQGNIMQVTQSNQGSVICQTTGLGPATSQATDVSDPVNIMYWSAQGTAPAGGATISVTCSATGALALTAEAEDFQITAAP